MTRFRSETTIPALIRANAEQAPDDLALVDGGRRYTFSELDAAMIDAVRAMIAFGIRPGDRVGVWAPNSADWLIAALGVMGAGGILLPINNRLRGSEATDILRRATASAVFTVNRFLDYEYATALRQAAPDLDVPIIDLSSGNGEGVLNWGQMLESGCERISAQQAIDRIASLPGSALSDILYTSGTTGLPKGVLSTHEKTIHAAGEYTRILGLGPSDVLLMLVPLGLMFGLKYVFLIATLARARLVMDAVFNVEATMRVIAKHGITYLPGPPTLVQDVLDSPQREDYDLSSLRRILLAGTYVPPLLISRIRAERLVEQIFVGYGLSEGAAIAMTRSEDDAETATRTVGRALPGAEIRIADEQGRDMPLDEPGEILVKAPWIMEGYYKDPVQTANAFTEDGWLKTGDSGSLDARGYLTMAGRKKDMYIVGGFNVYPAEVENCLMDYGAISQVAVVPIPDARLGEVGVAFVVPRADAELDEVALLIWARTRLANFKVPRVVYVVDALPMNASAKVLRNELREQARLRFSAAV